jgi:lipopolysaccharide heptosyltransferase II
MKVLFITLSNIGDAVLTTPAISAILENFKDAEITVMASPRAAELFKGDPALAKVIVYRKDASLGHKMALIKNLRGIEFDLLVDFKDTMLPFLLYAKRKTLVFKKPPDYITHMKDRHMWRLKAAFGEIQGKDYKPHIWVPEDILSQTEGVFKSNNIYPGTHRIVSVAPGARSHTKQWTKEGFMDVCSGLAGLPSVKVVLVGDQHDSRTSTQIVQGLGDTAVLDLCGKTGLKELTAVLEKSSLLITNDSAPMHLAWAVGTPVVAIFGPTDPARYRPMGPKDVVIRKTLECSPCRQALCKSDNECMELVSPEEVFEAARGILGL